MNRVLTDNLGVLTHPENQLFRGLNNELQRISRVHGFGQSELLQYLIIKALDHAYEYQRYPASARGEDSVEMTPEFTEVLDQSVELLESLDKLTPEELIGRGKSVILAALTLWRIGFVKYMEHGELRLVPALPPESGQKEVTQS